MVRMPESCDAIQLDGAVLHEPAEAVAEADDLHAVGVDGRLGHAADGRVEPRAVAARGQDADRLGHSNPAMDVLWTVLVRRRALGAAGLAQMLWQTRPPRRR